MATDELIAGLRAEGELDSTGRFTLDRAKAREKLQKFQLVDAHRYVLELVQAAVLRGAGKIAFDIDADDMHMRFDGAVFTKDELDDVWGSIFADGDERLLRGVRQLALGLNAALGTAPKRIVVRSGGQELRLVPGAEDVHRAVEPAIAGTTIHVVQRVKLKGIGLFFKNLVGQLAEEVHLVQRCVYAAPEITLDGVKISRGMQVDGALGVAEIATPGTRGLVAVTKEEGPGELRLIKDGVWIDARPLVNCGPGVLAIVEGDALRKDVSLAQIVADEALAAVWGLVGAARWSAMVRVLGLSRSPEGAGRGYEQRVRTEALRFLSLAEMPAGPDRTALLDGLTWSDARTYNPERAPDHGRVSLRELSAAMEAGSGDEPPVLRYSPRVYGVLAPEGRPIPFVVDGECEGLARVLGGVLVPDEGIARAAKRAEARKKFLTRKSTLTLPASQRYEVRGTFEGDGISGQLGVSEAGAEGSSRRWQEGTTWLYCEGCLLTVMQLDWGIPGLEVAVEARFEPTDDFADAVRDEVVVDVALHVLAALPGLLSPLVYSKRTSIEGGVRGIVKSWLMLVFDEAARTSLWSRMSVPRELWPSEAAVREVLPRADEVLGGPGMGWLMRVGLFEDFDGERRSLEELAARLKKKGQLDELDRSTAQVPGVGKEVLWLGRGDRLIAAALFGASALKSWVTALGHHQKERAFRDQPRESLEAVTRRLGRTIEKLVSPGQWSRKIEEDGVRGVVMLARGQAVPTAREGLRQGQIELYLGERRLCTRTLDLGIGPVIGAVSYGELRATTAWNDVVEDAALERVVGMLSRAAWALFGDLVRSAVDPERWLTQLVLRRLERPDRADVTQRLPHLMETPLVTTISGARTSLTRIEATIALHGHITWVPPTTPEVSLADPPVLRERPAVIEALRGLVGAKALVEGDVRVQQQQAGAILTTLPLVKAVRLDPSTVWAVTSLDSGSPKLEGEIGLCRQRTSGGLSLTLCTLGRRVGTITEASVEVACEAILADARMPLTASATVDTRSKQYGQYLKRCRRAVYGLVVGLSERFEALTGMDRAQARSLLLGFVTAERKFGETRREARQTAWDAVCRLPLLVDVWGKERSLAEVEASLRSRVAIEVVRSDVQPPPGTDRVDRPILRVDGAAELCLAGLGKISALDERWAEMSAALQRMAAAPEFVLPNLREVAWIDRKATIAGLLQAHLWIPREPDASDALVFTHDGRIVGRLVVFDGVSCAGVVHGEGLVIGRDGEVVLGDRQRASLAKQVCTLIETLARQARGASGQMHRDERERAKVWLVEVAEALEQTDPELIKELGKPFAQLQATLAPFASPAMRKTREPPKPVVVAEAPVVAAAPMVVVEEEVEVEVEVEPEPVVVTPELALLAGVRAELEWARQRHGSLLERMRLDRLAIGMTGSGIATFEDGVVLQKGHPLVARQLARIKAGQAADPIDMMFIVSAVYTLMNWVSEEITADDEQAFVARMAEGLALALG
jgi:hypothetical protein